MEVFNLAAYLSLAEVGVFVHVFDTDTYCNIFVMMYCILIKPSCTVINFKVFFMSCSPVYYYGVVELLMNQNFFPGVLTLYGPKI